ncbi:hypothetical protein [Trinickia symbiotica]|uniref:hypothetical protein n=1 Tax=Trinickia symbiotica TaxID=863227 RepID=UPI0011B1D836|nr:hypothetical protein [Trinickia symbiotica]
MSEQDVVRVNAAQSVAAGPHRYVLRNLGINGYSASVEIDSDLLAGSAYRVKSVIVRFPITGMQNENPDACARDFNRLASYVLKAAGVRKFDIKNHHALISETGGAPVIWDHHYVFVHLSEMDLLVSGNHLDSQGCYVSIAYEWMPARKPAAIDDGSEARRALQ